MKLSISLPAADVELLDTYVRQAGLPSRSAGVQRAINGLAQQHLEADYDAAWEEWEASGEAEAWETTAADGVADASR